MDSSFYIVTFFFKTFRFRFYKTAHLFKVIVSLYVKHICSFFIFEGVTLGDFANNWMDLLELATIVGLDIPILITIKQKVGKGSRYR